MDRNLGARDTKRAADGYKGALTYQFGRKDPFPSGLSGKTTCAYIGRGELEDEGVWTIEDTSGPVSISTSIRSPMKFYTSTVNWASEADSESIIWYDYEADVFDNGKSIFDPSPKGWKIAPHGTWSNFSEETMTDWDYENFNRGYPRINPITYYFAAQYRVCSSGSVSSTSVWDRIYLWASMPSGKTYSYYIRINLEEVTPSSTIGTRPHGFALRCVQHYE